MQLLEKFKRIDPVNRGYFEKYLRMLNLKSLRPRTIDTKLWRIYQFLSDSNFKDSRLITREDVEDYVIQRKNEVTPITLQGELLEVRLFLRWLTPDKEKDLFPEKMRRVRHTLPMDRLLTKNDISKLVDACRTQRDRALVMFMWDSGARISEIMALKIGDIQFDRYGAVVIVRGKTDRRRLRLTACIGDLQAWVNVHPMRENSEAPLFVTQWRYGSDLRHLSVSTVQNTLKIIARRAGVNNVHPHAIRHARLTDLVKSEGPKKGLSEMELRIVAGWEKSSRMPEVYVHLSGEDVEKKILMNAGLLEEDYQNPVLEAKKCPRCGTINAHDSLFCKICSAALNESAARQVDTMHQSVMDNLEIMSAWIDKQKAERTAPSVQQPTS
jgi:integrase